MKYFSLSLAACLTIALTGAALAQDTPGTDTSGTGTSPTPGYARTGDRLREGWYTQLTGAATFFNDKSFPLFTGDGRNRGNIDYDTGWNAALDFGYRFSSGFRLQGEAAYGRVSTNDFEIPGRDLNINNGDLTVGNALLGIYYDFNIGGRWSPYAGLGGGAAWTDLDDVPGRASNLQDGEINGTAYAEGGVEFLLDDNISLVPSYRYQWINNGEHGAEDDDAHMAMLGLRFYFD